MPNIPQLVLGATTCTHSWKHPAYLHSSCVPLEDVCRSAPRVPHMGIPHIDDIIIPPASKEPAAGGPLDPAHVKGVSLEGVHVELGHPDVVVVDLSRLGTTAQQVGLVVPGQATHSRGVGPHSTYHLAGVHIPQLCMGRC